MSEPIYRTDIVAEAQASLITAFRGKPVINAVVASYAKQAQELENMFFQLMLLTTLSGSTGAQLDGIGLIVDERRKGKNDTDYRAALGSRIAINKSSPTVNQILGVLTSVQDRMYFVRELGYAAISITAGGTYTPSDPNVTVMYEILQQTKAAGVRADYIYHVVADSNVFTTASGEVSEYDANKGAANDSETTGGHLADVVYGVTDE